MILGISASGGKDGNLERMVRKVLDLAGGETRLVRLPELSIRPCTGCVGCAKTNRCVQADDGNRLLDLVEQASAVVVGAVNYFAAPNAFAATALERLYPLRHRQYRTAGKAAAALVVGGGMGNDRVVEQLQQMLGQYLGFTWVGSTAWASQVPPCFSCGFGATCPNGMPAMMAGGVEKLKGWRATPEMFRKWEEDPAVLPQLEALARSLKTGGRGYF